MQRRDFIKSLSILSAGACLPVAAAGSFFDEEPSFARHLKLVGRALEMEVIMYGATAPSGMTTGKHMYSSPIDREEGEERPDQW